MFVNNGTVCDTRLTFTFGPIIGGKILFREKMTIGSNNFTRNIAQQGYQMFLGTAYQNGEIIPK
jgi:hypothetical protein